MMSDDELQRKLRAVELSRPGISLEQVMAAAGVPQARGSSWRGVRALALATAAVWLLVWVAQEHADRSLRAISFPAAAVAVGLAGGGFADRQTLLDTLLFGDWEGCAPARPEPQTHQRGDAGSLARRRLFGTAGRRLATRLGAGLEAREAGDMWLATGGAGAQRLRNPWTSAASS